jgi:3-hydroxyisobutyrate dehydrogenase
MDVALLGTGLLGQAAAERLHAMGHNLSAYNRSAEKTLSLRRLGIRIAPTAEEAISHAKAILLLLSDAAAIRAVLLNQDTKRAVAERTIIQMGTIGPSESRSIKQEIEDLGGRYLEAPVLGSMAEARAGTLLIMVGAEAAHFAEWEPFLRSLGSEVRLIGPVGTAALLKLALNQLIAAETAAFALSLGLIRSEGMAVETFMALLRQSALYAPTFDKKLPRLLERQYEEPNFSVRHLLKDVELILREAETRQLASGGLQGVRSLLNDTIDLGLGTVDYSALYETIDPVKARKL